MKIEANNNTRLVQSDLIRCIAMVFVISVHTVNYYFDGNAAQLLQAIFFTCNPLFFMLSGKFNLAKEFRSAEDIIDWYKHKISVLVVPFVFYSFLLYTWKNVHTTPLYYMAYWVGFIKGLFTGQIATHLWFMYWMIGITLSTPFVAIIIRCLDNKQLSALLLIGMGWNTVAILVYADIFGNAPFPFQGWIFPEWFIYLILGYTLEKIKNKRHITWIIVAGAVSLIITYVQKTSLAEVVVAKNAYDISPLFTIFVVGVYILFDKVLIIKTDFVKQILTRLSKHTYSIYLFHSVFLGRVNNFIMSLNLKCAVSFILAVLTIVVVALVVTAIIDFMLLNVLIKHVDNFLRKRKI